MDAGMDLGLLASQFGGHWSAPTGGRLAPISVALVHELSACQPTASSAIAAKRPMVNRPCVANHGSANCCARMCLVGCDSTVAGRRSASSPASNGLVSDDGGPGCKGYVAVSQVHVNEIARTERFAYVQRNNSAPGSAHVFVRKDGEMRTRKLFTRRPSATVRVVFAAQLIRAPHSLHPSLAPAFAPIIQRRWKGTCESARPTSAACSTTCVSTIHSSSHMPIPHNVMACASVPAGRTGRERP